MARICSQLSPLEFQSFSGRFTAASPSSNASTWRDSGIHSSQSCRYSSWCADRLQGEGSPGPVDDWEESSCWEDMQDRCGTLDSADLQITEIDLTDATDSGLTQSAEAQRLKFKCAAPRSFSFTIPATLHVGPRTFNSREALAETAAEVDKLFLKGPGEAFQEASSENHRELQKAATLKASESLPNVGLMLASEREFVNVFGSRSARMSHSWRKSTRTLSALPQSMDFSSTDSSTTSPTYLFNGSLTRSSTSSTSLASSTFSSTRYPSAASPLSSQPIADAQIHKALTPAEATHTVATPRTAWGAQMDMFLPCKPKADQVQPLQQREPDMNASRVCDGGEFAVGQIYSSTWSATLPSATSDTEGGWSCVERPQTAEAQAVGGPRIKERTGSDVSAQVQKKGSASEQQKFLNLPKFFRKLVK